MEFNSTNYFHQLNHAERLSCELNQKLSEISQKYGVAITMPIHGEIMIDGPEDKVKAASKAITEIFVNPPADRIHLRSSMTNKEIAEFLMELSTHVIHGAPKAVNDTSKLREKLREIARTLEAGS